MDNSKGVVVYRLPSTLVGSHKAFAPILGLDDTSVVIRQQETSRDEQKKLMMSMTPAQRNAYLAKRGLTGNI